LGFTRIPARLLLLAAFFSIVPDFDVLSLRLGIPYADIFGHRGLTHSLFFAVLAGCLGAGLAPLLHCRRALAALLLFTAVACHIALDAATSGGQGVAAFWPLSSERFFLPWRPIRVSPISLHAFFSTRGVAVLLSELRWIWLPALGLVLFLRLWLALAPKIFKPHTACPSRLLAAAVCIGLYLLLPGKMQAVDRETFQFMEGDILFQSSSHGQGRAIQLATKSRYTHCGVIFKQNDRLYVYEAINKMAWTSIENWTRRGDNGHYVLMRLKNRDRFLTAEKLSAMYAAGEELSSKTYDLLFQWTDDKIYCSELVWKIYARGAGIELAPLKKFQDYDLEAETVQLLIKQRYGQNFSLEELAVSPDDLLQSPLLEKVYDN
jgi:membrane-bound metal-dependent hydrolase YbcI (DUF457 family)